jgi:hypothetical protein
MQNFRIFNWKLSDEDSKLYVLWILFPVLLLSWHMFTHIIACTDKFVI